MTPYCSSTGTKSTRKALSDARWRVLVVATGNDKNYGLPYAMDNGAWSAHVNERPFDVSAFQNLLYWSKHQKIRPDWCVVPDIVGGGNKSLEFSREWLPKVSKYNELSLIAVQDGMTPKDVESMVGPKVGIFLGGSTDWKLHTMMSWGRFCARRCYFHVARVNSARRIAMCGAAGADSFDGTSVCRFPKNLGRLNRARNQLNLGIFSRF